MSDHYRKIIAKDAPQHEADPELDLKPLYQFSLNARGVIALILGVVLSVAIWGIAIFIGISLYRAVAR